ncbi:ATP-binding protein [Streptomyces sp. NPDC050636]|uniref:ATP-binding protein n=1 Tax=Streptomyces sp. NPDC050636 TaxID=3154510 RepID=UPI00342372A6
MKFPAWRPHRHELTIPAVPSSVRLARQEAERAYASWGFNPSHPVLGPSLLVLSELVTNSVRHAAPLSPQLTVICSAGPRTIAFGVYDHHPGPLDPQCFPQSPGGLATVAEVITDLDGTWTVHPDEYGGGKTVWITLPL